MRGMKQISSWKGRKKKEEFSQADEPFGLGAKREVAKKEEGTNDQKGEEDWNE